MLIYKHRVHKFIWAILAHISNIIRLVTISFSSLSRILRSGVLELRLGICKVKFKRLMVAVIC